MVRQPSPAHSAAPLAVASGISWFWAFCLLAAKEYDPLGYFVSQHLPPLWGFLGGSIAVMVIGGVATGLLIVGCLDVARRDAATARSAGLWLLASLLIPLVDAVITFHGPLPGGYLLAIAFAMLTGLVAGRLAANSSLVERLGQMQPHARLGIVWILTVACGAWWYWQGCRAYDDFLLGYSDFGHFAVRVINTWEGRGFLKQASDLPIFWDHFNPGLALLAPLWGLWPSAKLFILLQAICIALPAPLVYGTARRLNWNDTAALCWSAAYLALPAVGQLNLSYGYGWHPESIALPLLFGAGYALLRRQHVVAAGLALLAASYAEVVVVAVGCVAFASLIDSLVQRRTRLTAETSRSAWTDAVSPWSWLAVWLFFTAGFVVIHQTTEASRFQEGRFVTLGASGWEILLSPVLRPHIFWSYIFRPRCLYFLLAVFGPLGLGNIARSKWLALALLPPLLVLLAWRESSGTSIAFQYTTTLIPLGFLTALASVRNARPKAQDDGFQTRIAVTAFMTAITLSTFIGAIPWSSPTLHILAARNYPPTKEPGDLRPNRADERAVGSPGNAALYTLLEMIGSRDAKVLATGRVAAHLLHTQYVETIDNISVRREALAQVVGSDQSPLELFDWILIDTLEHGHQTPEKVGRILEEAKAARFQIVYSEHNLLLLRRPQAGEK